MFGNYRAAFRAPGSAAFSSSAFVMRLPQAAYPLALILLISTRTHHYGFAGVLSGVFVFGGAAGNPFGGRLVDRYSQRRVIVPLTAIHVAAAAVLIALARAHAPDWSLLPLAFVMGFCYLPVGSLVRARWSKALDGPGDATALASAYSFESIVDEIIYIVGPLYASVIATQVDPLLVFVISGVLVGTGAVLLARLRSTQPAPYPVGAPRRRSAIHERGVVLMCVIAAAMGAIFASAEVAMVAFCGNHHAQSWTGLVLAAMAAGSAVSGLWYGSRTWRRSLLDRFRIQAIAFGVLPWVFLAASNVGSLAACAFITGFAVAPALITMFSVVSELVPSTALTEGLAIVLTGLNIGYGLAAAVAGRVSDAWGTRAAFGVTIAAATALAGLATVLHARLRADPADVSARPGPVIPVDVGR
jgi:predicted MFS family arabinose efflux permease